MTTVDSTVENNGIIDPPATPSPPADKGVDPNTLFDTSEADAILGGLPTPQSTETLPAESQPQQQDPAQLTAQQVQQLREQLGIKNEPLPSQEPPVDSTQFSEAFTAANTKFEELSGMGFGDAIDAYMQAKVGMDLKSTIETVQQMSSYISQRQGLDAIDQQRAELKREWGQNFDVYFQLAQDEFKSLDDSTKRTVDQLGAEGARLLLAKALQTKGIPQSVARAPFASSPNVGTSPQNVTVGNQPTLRLSEIVRMPESQYTSPEVQQALATGNYIKDIQ